ncbi:hypothetical protein BVX98_05940 [bacterium F11]|nr:hypothetical protein BVX98_05940 [bacterium F11]
MKQAHFRIWWFNNWLKWSVATIVVVCAVSLFAGGYVFLFQLESFQKMTLIATAPMYMFHSVIAALAFVFCYWLFLYGGMAKLKASRIKAEDVNVHFSDVIGIEEGKKEAKEVVELIRDRARVKKIGGSVIKGILLLGPPGCGKTLLAKAIATEAKVPFISTSGSEFVEIFVGVGASRIRSLLKRARLMAEAHGSCIVFIDELDVIGRGRTFSAFGASEETNSTQNQLLVEMDGVHSGKDNIIFIGATNADESKLDSALVRPGRFDRKIFVGKPHLKEREDIFRYYLNKISVDPSVDVTKLAQRTVTKSPADIESSVKEAAIIATRDGRDRVEFRDFSQAFERIDLGIAHRLPLANKEKERIAIHESGHLLAVYHQHPTHDVFKATILHRGGALGHVLPVPKEETYTRTRENLIADIKVSLAGFISERIKYGTTSTGASSDFANALSVASAMVWQFGMGKSGIIGNYAITMGGMTSTLSEAFKKQLNDEAQEILKMCEKETEEFLRKEWKMVEVFATLLIEKEELNYDEIEEVFKQHGNARA